MDKVELFPVKLESQIFNFNQYLAKLNDIAQRATHENFVMIQRTRSDILNDCTAGRLSDLEKRTLYNTATIIRGNMRKQLGL